MQLDAYAIRKMAPRLLIAVVAVNLSIYLCLAAVDIANIVGRGIGQLLITPFADADVFNISLKANKTNVAAGAVGFGIVGGSGILAGAGILGVLLGSAWTASVAGAGLAIAGTIAAGLLPFLFLAVVSIGFIALAVLLTVIIRQGLIVFLIVISPIAIALFVLPGTEKYFRQWWSIFVKTLLVYPIIAVIFAMSDILGALILNGATKDNVSGSAGLAMIMTGIVVVYAPLFLIPFAFKFAGGVLGAMYDVAQGQTGKANGGLRNKIRQSQQDPNSWLGGLSKRSKETRQDVGLTPGHVFGGTVAGLKSRSRGEGFRRGYSADARVRSNRLANKSARESQELDAAKEIGSDDDTSSAYDVAQKGGSRAAQDAELARVAPTRFKRKELDLTDAERMGLRRRNATTGEMEWVGDGKSKFDTLTAYENTPAAIAARNKNADDALAQIGNLKGRVGGKAGQQMAVRNIATTTTGYKTNAEMTQRVVEASRRTDGTVDMQQLAVTLGETKKAAMGVGRVDYGGSSFTSHIDVAQRLANGTMTLDEAEQQLSASVIKKQSAGTLAQQDTRSLEVMAPHMLTEVRAATDRAIAAKRDPMQDQAVQAAYGKIANLYDTMSYANAGNIDILSKEMGKTGIGGQEKTIRAVLESMRGKPSMYPGFANVRKDWSMGNDIDTSNMSPAQIAALHRRESEMGMGPGAQPKS